MAFWDRFRRDHGEVEEAAKALTPSQIPERAGYVYGIPRGGLNEYNSGLGEATQTDRRSQLQQLYEAYLSCPWSWACINAIARTITAGGLVMDWDSDTGEGDEETPEKPEAVLAVERLIAFTNDRQNIRQVLRNVVIDLLIFGDAYVETSWWGDTPVALYNLDVPTTTPIADEHGKISGYKQVTEYGQTVSLDPRDVIHISLDAPRSGVFGVSPTQANLLPITAWLFAAACGKEMARKGLPTNIHVDFPAGTQTSDQNRWLAQYAARNIGPRNIGTPVATKGGAHVQEIAAGKITDILTFLDQKRDEILSGYGVPPALVGVIESGNLGGGTGEEQRRALDLFTMIPTPSGWTTMGELKVGDQVLDENGRPCNVVGTYEVPDASSWRLRFSDGTHLDACLDHLWVTWTERDRKAFGRGMARGGRGLPEDWVNWKSGRGVGPQIRRTEEILSTLESRPGWTNHSIPVTGALELPEADLPLDPYILGAWLGDGTRTTSALTVADGEEQILEEIRAAGYEVRKWESQRNCGRASVYNVLGLRAPLKRAGVMADKHVPAPYLRASAAQRLALLQGLMDTDGGFIVSGRVMFCNTNERLADAVMELARSLGQKPVKAKRRSPPIRVRGQEPAAGIDYGPRYEVTWKPTIQVFRLKRKADQWNPLNSGSIKLHHRYIVGADKIPDRPMRCITVDSPNAMYLAGEQMIPTHNTYEIDTCAPIGELILEAFNFAIVQNGFGAEGWNAKFGEVDYRSSQAVEAIRDMRLRNGSYTLNRYRTEIGEPPVEGGDDAVLVDRQNLVLWSDMQAMSKAMIAGRGAPAVAAGEMPPGGEMMGAQPPAGQPAQDGEDEEDGKPPVPAEALIRYRARLREALRSMPVTESGGKGDAGASVYAQLAKNFPPGAIAWVKDARSWSGPKRIPIGQIDTTDRDHWNASRPQDAGIVARKRRRLRKQLAKGEHPKPLVLIKTPGSDKWLITDGHHRFLAAEAEGQEHVWAFTGRVDAEHGDWDVMAASEEGRDRAA